jgi:Fe-S-cluster-containing hydrogenase component 2
MSQRFPAIRLEREKCAGRMKCVRVCPTEAMRFRDGQVVIIDEKCIDCGTCITACPNGALVAQTDPFGELSRFKYTIGIPSPALYAQFGRAILPDMVLAGLKRLGFDDAYDLAITCGDTSLAIQQFLAEYDGPKPLIANSCPSVVRLVQVRYPQLVNHFIPIHPPKWLVVREIKEKKSTELGLAPEEIGAFYITPCPVKMIAVKESTPPGFPYIDGVISIADIYGPLLSALEEVDTSHYRERLESVCILGIGWAVAGGMHRTLRLKNVLDVSGIAEIVKTFDDLERGKLEDIDFVVPYFCPQGCIAGSLTVENPYVSHNKIIRLLETLEEENIEACRDKREIREHYRQGFFHRQEKYDARPIQPLDKDLSRAIKKRKEKDRIYESLPKIDCGICGAPTCLAFAEDVIRGEAELSDCIFVVPHRLKELVGEMSNLLEQLGTTPKTKKPRNGESGRSS